MSSAYRLTPQVSADRPERTDRAGEQTEHAVLEQQHLPDRASGRAERLEHRRLVDPLKLGHRDRANQDQRAAEAAPAPPTTVIASVTFDMTSRIVCRISWKSIDRHVRESLDEVVLKLRARLRRPPALSAER